MGNIESVNDRVRYSILLVDVVSSQILVEPRKSQDCPIVLPWIKNVFEKTWEKT